MGNEEHGRRTGFLVVVVGLTIAGCGAEPRPSPGGADASSSSSSSDAAVDAPFEPVPEGAVRVRALHECCDGAPEAGVPIILVDADGTVRPTQTTGLDGVVLFPDVVPGAQVMGLYATNLELVVGALPGDDLTFGGRGGPGYSPPTLGQAALSWPSHPGAASYWVKPPCQGGNFTATTGTLPVFTGCAVVADLAVYAKDPQGRVLATARLPGVSYQPDGVYDFTVWEPAVVATMTAVGIPAGMDKASLRLIEGPPGGDVSSYAFYGAPAGSTISGPIGLSGHASSYESSVAFDIAHPNEGGQVHHRGWPAGTTDFRVDVQPLPFVTEVTLDEVAQTVQWTTTGDGAYQTIQISFLTSTPNHHNRVTLPPDVTSWSWADLPEPARAYFGPAAWISAAVTLTRVDSDVELEAFAAGSTSYATSRRSTVPVD